MVQAPGMIPIGEEFAPEAPASLASTGVESACLVDLALRAAYSTVQFTTEWAAERLRLPLPLVAEILEGLRGEQMLETLGATGPLGYRYTISHRGRERAARLFEISGYVGPAPVSLAAYSAMVEWQSTHNPAITPQYVAEAISDLVIPDDARQFAGLAVASGRSLFVSGPPGNGKTQLARLLHHALHGALWIPHCFVVDSSIVRVFDPLCHQPADLVTTHPGGIDRRWVRIERPLIVVGGELTIDALDLAYNSSLRYYEAPTHVKANGGILLVDDFGRQRIDPRQLLNRWIIPLEYQIDYLTLHTGQKIVVPFREIVIFATNLEPTSITDPAFMRRMGYRLYLGPPTPERYAEIFSRYAAHAGVAVPPGLVERLLVRYQSERRELRGCEPRDLIERVRDICQFRNQPFELNDAILNLAWTGYFGEQPATG